MLHFDVLVLTEKHDEHLEVMEKVFTDIEGAGVEINIAKCQYFTTTLQYLGRVLSNEGALQTL